MLTRTNTRTRSGCSTHRTYTIPKTLNNNTIIIWHLNHTPSRSMKVTHATTKQNNSSKIKKNNNNKQTKKQQQQQNKQKKTKQGPRTGIAARGAQIIHLTLEWYKLWLIWYTEQPWFYRIVNHRNLTWRTSSLSFIIWRPRFSIFCTWLIQIQSEISTKIT